MRAADRWNPRKSIGMDGGGKFCLERFHDSYTRNAGPRVMLSLGSGIPDIRPKQSVSDQLREWPALVR